MSLPSLPSWLQNKKLFFSVLTSISSPSHFWLSRVSEIMWMLFCSYTTKNVSFLLITFFTIILDVISCASILVISWRKYNPFSAFTFISAVVNISSSLPLLLCEWLPLFGVLLCFLFSMSSFFPLLGLFRYSESALLRKKPSFLLNISLIILLLWSS